MKSIFDVQLINFNYTIISGGIKSNEQIKKGLKQILSIKRAYLKSFNFYIENLFDILSILLNRNLIAYAN